MSNSWESVRKKLFVGAIAIALVALTFSNFICHSALILLIVLWASEGKWLEKIRIVRGSMLLIVYGLFVLFLCVGVFYSSDSIAGIHELKKKILLFTLPFVFATTSNRLQQRDIRSLFYTFSAACLVVMAICLFAANQQLQLFEAGQIPLQFVDFMNFASLQSDGKPLSRWWLFFSYVGLGKGVDLHPSYLGLFLAFSTLFLLHEALNRNDLSKAKKSVLLFVAGVFIVFIAFLSSRIIIVGMLVIMAGSIVYYAISQRSTLSTAALGFLLVVVVSIVYINPVSRYRHISEPLKSSLAIRENSHYDTSLEIRASLWLLAWKAYTRGNLFFGSGTGSVDVKMMEAVARYNITNSIGTHDPHNQYLFILVENGLVGVLLLLAILVSVVWQSLAAKDFLLLGFLIIFLMLCMTESALERQKGIVFFAIVFPLMSFHTHAFQHQAFTLRYSDARR